MLKRSLETHEDNDGSSEKACHAMAGDEGSDRKRARVERVKLAFPTIAYPRTRDDPDGVTKDPFELGGLMDKAERDMAFWTAERIELLGKKAALEKLNQQLAEFDDLFDFGTARGKGYRGIETKRYPMPLCLHPEANVVAVVMAPTVDEQYGGGDLYSIVDDKGRPPYNTQIVEQLRNEVKRAANSTLQGIVFDRVYAVPMARFPETATVTYEGQDGEQRQRRISTGIKVFARYMLVGLSIVRPNVVVCLGQEPARAMLVDLASGEFTAPHEKDKPNAVRRRVVMSARGPKAPPLHTIAYFETVHPFSASEAAVNNERSVVSLRNGVKVEDNMVRNIAKGKQNAALNTLAESYKLIAARLTGKRLEVCAFSKMMSNRVKLEKPDTSAKAKAKPFFRPGRTARIEAADAARAAKAAASSSTTTTTATSEFSYQSPAEVASSSSSASGVVACATPETRVVLLTLRNMIEGVVGKGCDVYIGGRIQHGVYSVRGSKWANPHTVRQCGSVEETVRRYEIHLLNSPELMDALHELDGKRLGCFCKKTADTPCHGDVLVRYVAQDRNRRLGLFDVN